MASLVDIFYNDIMKNTSSLGPAPNPAGTGPGAGLATARVRVLRALRDLGGGTVGEVVQALGGHPNTVRHHLTGLVADGLVEGRQAPATARRGRPATRYRVTDAGRSALGEGPQPADEYLALAGAFADRLAAGGGDPGGEARAVGRAWGRSLAPRDGGDVPDGSPTRRVAALLERLGFSPATATDEADDEAGDGSTLLLRTCPLLEAARRHPEVVCQVHHGLVEAALPAHRGAPGVELRPFDRPGACVLRLPARTGPSGVSSASAPRDARTATR